MNPGETYNGKGLALAQWVRVCVASILLTVWCGHPMLHAQSAGVENPAPGVTGDLGTLLSSMAPDDCRGPNDTELSQLESAVAASHRAGDRSGETQALTLLGTLEERSGQYKTALTHLQRALTLVQQAKNTKEEAHLMMLLGATLKSLGKMPQALGDVNQSRAISEKAGDVTEEAQALIVRAEITWTSELDNAMKDLNQALELADKAHDLRIQALALNDQGAFTEDSDTPFDIFERALRLEDQIHDCRDKGSTLANLASLYEGRGQARKAVDNFTQALALERQAGDITSEAETLHEYAKFHQDIGDLGEALSLFQQALQLETKTGDLSSMGPTLSAIAGVYRDQGQPSTALHSYLKVLALLRQTTNAQWQVITLNNLGAVEADLKHPAEARTYYNRAIQNAGAARDLVTPAFSAWGIGELEQSDALANYSRAVWIAREFEQPDLEGLVDDSLMEHFRRLGQMGVAIFFGKQSVDRFLGIRRNMGGLSNADLSSFLHKKSGTYRTLAALLIDQERLIEAQQVLDVLKIQQYSDYVRGQPGELSEPLARSLREAAFQTQYEQRLSALVNLEKSVRDLDRPGQKPTPDTLRARSALRKSENDFVVFVRTLDQQLPSTSTVENAVLDATGPELLLDQLIAANPHTVVLYTLEGADRLRIVAVTPAGRFWRSYPISQDALDKGCKQFLEILRDHQQASVVLAAAQELFKAVFGPVQKDLEKLQPTTLVWSLDGSLRYIPINALVDPQTGRYLVEDYNVVGYTPLIHPAKDAPSLAGATAIAMGTTKNYDNDLGELPNTAAELDSVVHDPAVQDSDGVIPGTILLDGQFTERAMQEKVRAQAIVHIASHFVLTPGNDDLSYLLLGGKDNPDKQGYRFSMADFENNHDIHIEGTKLFTLSACQTGAENSRDDGVVMEGMSEAVLEKGVGAVISTLWSVNDKSTGALMASFYRRWAGSNGALSKTEALRRAELDLLQERIKPEPDLSNPNAPVSFADAYYWAPFVLTGDWR